MKILILSLILVFNCPSAFSEEQYSEKTKTYPVTRLLPRDDSFNEPSLQAFIEELKKRTAKKDLEYIKTIIAPDIRYSFGEEKTFLKHWGLDKKDYPKSDFWNKIDESLSFGGVLKDETNTTNGKIEKKAIYEFPYFSALWSEWSEKFDFACFSVLIAPDVEIYEKSDDKSKVLKKMSYIILKFEVDYAPNDPQKIWQPVVLPDGKNGFVKRKFIKNAIIGDTLRGRFKKINNKWILTSFISGD